MVTTPTSRGVLCQQRSRKFSMAFSVNASVNEILVDQLEFGQRLVNGALTFVVRGMEQQGTTTAAPIEPAQPQLRLHTFSDALLDTKLYFQCLMLKDSLFLWIGSTPPTLGVLNLAIQTPYVAIQHNISTEHLQGQNSCCQHIIGRLQGQIRTITRSEAV